MTTYSIKETGGDYPSISAFVADLDNLFASTDLAHGEIQDNRDYSESDIVITHGSDPAAKSVELSTHLDNFPDQGKWDNGKARLTQGGSSHVLTIAVANVHLHHLQIFQDGSGSSDEGIRLNADNTLVSYCIIKTNEITQQDCIYPVGTNRTWNIDNCILYNAGRGAINAQFSHASNVVNVDHCFIHNCAYIGLGTYGAGSPTCTVNCYNTYSADASSGAFGGTDGNFTWNGTNNAADDTSAETRFTSSYDSTSLVSTSPSSGENYWVNDHTTDDYPIEGENTYTNSQNGVNRIGSEPDPRQDFNKTIVPGEDRTTTPNIGPFAFGAGLVLPGPPNAEPDDLADASLLTEPAAGLNYNAASDSINSPNELTEPLVTAYFAYPENLANVDLLTQPNATPFVNAIPDPVINVDFIEHATARFLSPYGGYARRKPAGTGLAYCRWPAVENSQNFELTESFARMSVDVWHPVVFDGLTHARIEVWRDSNIQATGVFNQNDQGGQFRNIFTINNPALGLWHIRTYDDVNSGLGGAGDYVYADAFRINLDNIPLANTDQLINQDVLNSPAVLAFSICFPQSLTDQTILTEPSASLQYGAVADNLIDGVDLEEPIVSSSEVENAIAQNAIQQDILEIPGITVSYGATPDELTDQSILTEPVNTVASDTEAADVVGKEMLTEPLVDTNPIAGANGMIDSGELSSPVIQFSYTMSPNALIDETFLEGDLLGSTNTFTSGDNMADASVLESPAITVQYIAQPDALVDRSTLSVPDNTLSLIAESANITDINILQLADVFFIEDLPPQERTYYVRAEKKTYTVRPQKNVYTV